MNERYDWIDFYTAFANELLEYRGSRARLIEKIVAVFESTGVRFPKLDDGVVPEDIDPFTVFGLFNKGITDATRKILIAGFGEEFEIDAPFPQEFSGVPALNNLNATFYAFSGDKRRNPHDIDNLWRVFEAALAFADGRAEGGREAFEAAYDEVIGQFGISWKLTMGLYWIRPYAFINLDSRNRWYLGDRSNLSGQVAEAVNSFKSLPPAHVYLDFAALVRRAMDEGEHGCRTFPELSHLAWTVSERVNDENRQREKEEEKRALSNALGDGDVDAARYWLYAPGEGASMWDEFFAEGVMGLGWTALGDLSRYESKESMRLKLLEGDSATSQKNSALAAWQFAHEVRPGDIVFVKRGRSEILGKGVVESGYEHDPGRGRYPNIRKTKWTHKGEWRVGDMLAMKTLTDISDYPELIAEINGFFESPEGDIEEKVIDYPLYSSEDFLSEVFVEQRDYEALVDLLKTKKNVILQGAPGVGKTFVAKRLAYSIMGCKDVERVGMVQFHQSYSYEDFVMGFRPNSGGGFELRKGIFYNFCKEAAEDVERDHFFIIDEINRGNLSKVFGELFMLIEADKRGKKNRLQLLYSDELFYVPENVYLIGMMNTADRSLALLDYALRRRFCFYELKPGFSSDGFGEYRRSLGNERYDRLIRRVEDLNARIACDDSLGPGFCIGHSYFCNLTAQDIEGGRLSQIVDYEIVPLLKEYWFDDPATVREWEERLKGALK